jgi:hypothetical protein
MGTSTLLVALALRIDMPPAAIDPELQELIDCVNREADIVGINPFITAIRAKYGPRKSLEVLQEWLKNNG